MTKIFLFNGPPSCGKDTIVENAIKRTNDLWVLEKFAYPLKKGMRDILSLSDSEYEYYDSPGVKDQPQERFFGVSPRNFQINLSELFFKPTFGEDIFGRLMVDRIKRRKNYQKEIFLVSDSGFESEAKVLLDEFGKENVFLFRINREGCDYNNDSRGYIELPGISRIDIENNSTLESLYENSMKMIYKCLS